MKTISKGLLLIALISLAIISHGQKTKEYKSLLWEISGNGLSQPSYLYGTMHVSNKVAFHLTDSFFINLKASDMVALETNPQEWLQDMEEMGYFKEFLPNNYVYGSGFYEKAFELEVPDIEILRNTMARDNSMVNSLLSRISAGAEDFSEQTYLDLFIYRAGVKQGKKATNLEGYEESLLLGMRASIPDESKEAKRKEAIRGYKLSEFKEKGQNPYYIIEEAYRRGNLGTIDSIMNILSPERYKSLFLTARNIIMMDKLDSLMQSKNRVFAGIGAAHLPGDSGAIELLRHKGYKVRPVKGEKTKKGDKIWKKIEKKFIDKPLDTEFTSADQMFKLKVPGFMIEMSAGDHGKDYLYADMANGAYYTVSRLNLYNFIDGTSQSDIEKRLDSVFYESIPGEILSKEKTTRFGYPCYNIKNKTTSGDYQQYQILITPLELFVFKVGGPGKFVKKTDHADAFFSSIEFLKNPQASAWEQLNSHKGGFSLQLPKYYEQKGAAIYGAKSGMFHNLIQAYDGASDSRFLILQRALHDFEYIEQDTFELRMIIDAFKEEHNYKIESKSLGELESGHSYIRASLKSDEKGTLDLMCVLKGPQYYLLISKSDDEKAKDKFFNSFKVSKATTDLSFKTITDTAMLFTVETIKQQGAKFRPYIMRRSSSRYSYQKSKKYESESKSHDFFNIQTAEVIDVSYYKYHNFYESESEEYFWERIKERAIDDDYTGLKIDTFITFEKDGAQYGQYHVSDSSSQQKIYGQVVVNGGVAYTMKTCYDGILGLSEFQTKFFKTFKPLPDTTAGVDIFSDKGQYMLNKLNSEDSTDRKAAFASLNYYSYFKDEHAKQMMDFVDSYDFEEDEDHKEYQAEIIEELGGLSDKADMIIDYCDKKYEESADDRPDLQFASLQVLADLETKASYSKFKELVVSDPPLTQSNDILYIFYRLDDSLEIAKDLYPEILELTEFEEYEQYVYQLLAAVVDSGHTDGGIYKNHLRTIKKEAKYALKRQQSRDQADDESDVYEDYFDSDYYESNWSRHELSYFTTLLIPFISDNEVKELLNDMLEIKDKELKLLLATQHLEAGLEVPQEVWTDLEEEDEDLPLLYNVLKELDKTDLISDDRLTQFNIVRGRLFDGVDFDKDSVEFIEMREYNTNEGTPGRIYLFKSKEEDEEEWELNFMAFTYKNGDTTTIKTDYAYYRKGISYNEEDEEDYNDKIKDYIKWLGIKDHKRIEDIFRSSYLYNYY